jgi:16S rRNA (uracil1498-N3)-methyltransferase
MTRRRWIADEVAGNRAALTGAHADHLTRALRARVGQEFDISTGAEVRRGVVSDIRPGRVEFSLGEFVLTPSAPHITLAISIFKFDRMEWAIEKCTELGASRIIPVIARRTETHLAAAAAKRVERWQRIAREAAQQCRRVSSPEICQPVKLKDAVELSGGKRVVLSESESEAMLRDILQTYDGDVVLAIGPEGGWTDAELALFCDTGWISASLGSTILRAETAAIAALAVALAELA